MWGGAGSSAQSTLYRPGCMCVHVGRWGAGARPGRPCPATVCPRLSEACVAPAAMRRTFTSINMSTHVHGHARMGICSYLCAYACPPSIHILQSVVGMCVSACRMRARHRPASAYLLALSAVPDGLVQMCVHALQLMQCAALGGTYGALLHQNPSVLQQVPMTVMTVDCMH